MQEDPFLHGHHGTRRSSGIGGMPPGFARRLIGLPPRPSAPGIVAAILAALPGSRLRMDGLAFWVVQEPVRLPLAERGERGGLAGKGHTRPGVHRRLVADERAKHAWAAGSVAVAGHGKGNPRSNAGIMDERLLLVAKELRPTSDQGAAIPRNAVRLRHGIVPCPPGQDGHAARSPEHSHRTGGNFLPRARPHRGEVHEHDGSSPSGVPVDTYHVHSALEARKSGLRRIDLSQAEFVELRGVFRQWISISSTSHEGPWQKVRHVTAALAGSAKEASSTAWGGIVNGAAVPFRAGGVFPEDWLAWHINSKRMFALYHFLLQFFTRYPDTLRRAQILVDVDNKSVVGAFPEGPGERPRDSRAVG